MKGGTGDIIRTICAVWIFYDRRLLGSSMVVLKDAAGQDSISNLTVVVR
jgi:hypothetical protein